MQTEITIGTPAYSERYGAATRMGWVQEIGQPAGGFVIGGGGMKSAGRNLVIVWDNNTTSEVSEGIAAPWINKAAEYGMPSPKHCAEELDAMRAAAEAVHRAEMSAAQEKRDKEREAAAAFAIEAAEKMPADARAVMVATMEIDDCDTMTDYFNVKSGRSIILAWSTHTRDLFPEMRKAALNHPDTAHLAEAPESAEHREKYSMGSGYYLKDALTYSTGWKIHKVKLCWAKRGQPVSDRDERARRVPVGEWSIPERAPAPAPAEGGNAYTLEKRHHTKKGRDFWAAVPKERVEREVFDAERDRAKVLGGWWSRAWAGQAGCFAFWNEDDAREFVGAPDGGGGGDRQSSTPALADKLSDIADKLDDKAADLAAPRLENTPKRRREAGSRRHDLANHERAVRALRRLAVMAEAGEKWPSDLEGVNWSQKKALGLAQERIDHSQGGYYDPGRPTGEPSDGSAAAAAFWAMAGAPDPEAVRAREIAELSARIQPGQFDGYFPTPQLLAYDLVLGCDLEDGQGVFDLTAGDGALLSAAKEACAGVEASGCEIQPDLVKLARAKGLDVEQGNAWEREVYPSFDAVLLNPPFEQNQAPDFFCYAWRHVKPGGVLAAILPSSIDYRNGTPWERARELIDAHAVHRKDNPPEAFKPSGVNVATVSVWLRKPVEG